MSTSAPTAQFFSLADLSLPTSQSEYMALWTAAMQVAFPGYNPTANPADRAYIQALVFSSWAADLGQQCSYGSVELFRQFGLQLLQLPYEQGTPALAIITVTAADTAGYTLPQGTQVTLTLSGATVAFQTVADLVIPNGSSSGTATIAAVQSGSSFNGATTPVALVSQINWVTGISLVTSASNGVDQEDPDAYVQRIAQALTTLGYATATAGRMAIRAADFIPALGTDQEVVGRATAIDGYSPNAAVFTVTATSSSPNLTVTAAPATGVTAAPGASILGTDIPSSTFTANTTISSPTLSSVSSFTNLVVGDLISGAGVPSGTTLIALTPGSSQATMSANATATASTVTITDSSSTIINSSTPSSIVMSQNATGSGTGISATVAGTLGNERTVTVCITDASGNALNSDTMAAVAAYLATFRELGFIINVIAPSYSTIWVACTVAASSGYSSATVQANVQAALVAYLSPVNFGLPQGAVQGWQNSQTVYNSRVLAVIQSVLGVDHVVPGSLTLGLAASPSDTSDLVLAGAFPLPESTTTSIPTSAITVTT